MSYEISQDREILESQLTQGAVNVMELDGDIYLNSLEDDATCIAAKVLDGVWENDQMNGVTLWDSAQDMAGVYLEEGDFRPEFTQIESALNLIKEIATLSGNLK